MRFRDHQSADEGMPRRAAARIAGLAMAVAVVTAGAPLAASAAEVVPTEGTLAASAPVDAATPEGPSADASTEDAPAEDAPAGDAPAGEVPAEEVPAEDVPADEAPADEAPADEAPADEAAADVAEQLPVGDPSGGEAPLDDADAEASQAKQPAAPSFAPEPQGAGDANTAPVAVDDHWQMVQDTTLTVQDPAMQANDYDADGDWFRINENTFPASGELVVFNGGPSFRYTPVPGFTGTVTFDYHVRDDHGADDLDSNWATVTIDVLPTGSDVDAQPVAVDDTYIYAPETPLYIGAHQGLLVNDQLDGLPVTSLTFPYGAHVGNGDVQMLGTDGSFYIDPGDAPGLTATLEYRVCTAVGCDDGYLWLYPAAPGSEPSGPDEIPGTPTAEPDVFGVVQDTMLSIKTPGLLFNDTDPEPGDTLEVVVDADGLSGDLAWAANGGFVYTPLPGYTGVDTFHYRAKDSHGYLSASVAVELQVGDGSVNHRPVAVDDHYSVVAGESLYLPAPSQVANDTDADGDALEWAGTGDLPAGTWKTYSDGWSTYTPPAGFVGTDRLTYSVRDEHGLVSWNEAEITIDVVESDGSTNTPPVPTADRYFVQSGESITVPAAGGVLANDTDADGDPLAVLVAYPALGHGEVEMAEDGSFTFTADAGFTGTAWLEFSITDGRSKVNSPSAEVVIFAEGEEPVMGADDAYTTTRGAALEVAAPGLLANDHAPAGVEKSVAYLLTEPAHGSIDWNADGSFVYSPEPDFTGSDTFRYVLFADGEYNYPTVRIEVFDASSGEEDPTEPGTPAEPADPGAPDDGAAGGTPDGDDPAGPAEPGGAGEPAATPPRPEDAAPVAAPAADDADVSALAETGADARGAAEASALAVMLGLVALVAARLRRRDGIR
ncbi:Ig-like domain-containing protein [Agromyces sp. NPDC055658]